MMKTRLNIEDRILIQELLKQSYKQKDIARAVGVSPSTISREIKNRRISNKALILCNKTNRFPFVCQGCPNIKTCRKNKFYYNYKNAENDYQRKLKYSRIGIDMSIDEVQYWDDYFQDKLKKKNQPILHIFKSIENIFPRSIQTFYKYVHKGYFSSINNEMLARSSSYKPRKKKEEFKTISRNNAVKQGRTIEDFKNYLEKNKINTVVEMDTVIGKFEDKKCLLTLFFRDCKLMLMFLVDKYKPISITNIFNKLKESLSDDLFKKLFEVILTDNGWEFSKPEEIEINNQTGEKLVNIFYTDPYSSWQKGSIERNHEFIRYIIPKGISFDNLTIKNVIDMTNNINNVIRKSLNFQSPFSLFKEKYGNDICLSLGLSFIHKEDINLSYNLLYK